MPRALGLREKRGLKKMNVDVEAIFPTSDGDKETKSELLKVIETVECVFADETFLRVLCEELRVKRARLCQSSVE